MSKIQNFQNIVHMALKSQGIIYVTLGNIIGSILAALFWLVLARIIVVESYGYVNYTLALAALGGAISLVGLNITLMTYLPRGKELAREASLIVFLVSLIVCTIFIILQLFYVAILVVVSSVYRMFLSDALGRQNYRKWMLLNISSRSGQLIGALSLYTILGIAGILIGYILPPLILSAPLFLRIATLRLTTLKQNLNLLKSKLNFSLHAYGVHIAKILVSYLDKILIGWIFGFAILGLYHLGYQFFWMASILPISLFQYLLPQKAGGFPKREIKFLGISASIIIALVSIILSPLAIRWIFPHFTESIILTQIMCLAVIPATIVNIESADLFGDENSAIVFKSNILALITEISGLILMGKLFGTVGLAITIVITQIVLAICLRVLRHTAHSIE